MKKRKLIDFIIIGTQKAGTTTLNQYFRFHPEITMGKKKELHFFDKDDNFSNSLVDYDAYHNLFSEKPNYKFKGECTPSYLYMKLCAERIYNYNKEIKLIAILRNPIDRAYSHWNMQRTRKVEKLGFMDSIINESSRLTALDSFQKKKFAYLGRGFYVEQIKAYQKFFPEDQLLILKYEDYINQQEKMLYQIFKFIGANPEKYSYSNIRLNKRAYETKMTELERNYLTITFEKEIKQLEKLLNWDCSDWLI